MLWLRKALFAELSLVNKNFLNAPGKEECFFANILEFSHL